MGLVAKDVLVDGVDFVVAQEVERKRVDLRYVAANQHVRSQQRPQGDVGVLLIGRQLRVAQGAAPSHLPHDEHVGVVPVAGTGIGMEPCLPYEAVVVERLPRVVDVVRGAPGVGVDQRSPYPRLSPSVLTEGVEDVARLLPDEFLHLQVGTYIYRLRLVAAGFDNPAVAAHVIFKVVHPPAVPHLGILPLVAE